jgi:hypothetical protein
MVIITRLKLNSVGLVRERTIPTELPPLVGKVSANFCVVRATVTCGRILGFLYRSRYYFSQVALQLYSQGRVDPVPDPLLLRKSGSAGNRILDLWICSQELWPLDHRGGIHYSFTGWIKQHISFNRSKINSYFIELRGERRKRLITCNIAGDPRFSVRILWNLAAIKLKWL